MQMFSGRKIVLLGYLYWNQSKNIARNRQQFAKAAPRDEYENERDRWLLSFS